MTIPIARPAGVPGDQDIRVYTCDACGMGYSDDGVTQAALDAYYAKLGKYGDLGVYSGGAQGGLGTEAPWELARARALAGFIAAHAPADSRVLDLGCSTGTLLVLLGDVGFVQLAGIEPLPGAVAIARDARGLDVRTGWITSIPEGDEYDVIALSHVLEHVLDLRDALTEVHRHLTPGGMLVVEIPDSHRFHEHIHIPFQDFNTEHINHFSPAILSALVESVGFECVEMIEDVAGAGPDHPYPVVRGAWRRVDAAGHVAIAPEEMQAHRASLEAYATGSEALFNAIDRRTEELVSGRTFAIWGAGQFTMKWLRRDGFPREQLLLVADTAASRVGLHLLGYEVVHPDALVGDEWPPVILAGSAYAAAAIREAARARGIAATVASPFPTSDDPGRSPT